MFGALKAVLARLPFALLGVDSDSGSEFNNAQMLRYCQQEKVTFTRGRAGAAAVPAIARTSPIGTSGARGGA